jgi:iron complex outermembrane receptor protein
MQPSFTGLARQSDTKLPTYPDDKVYLAPALTFKPDEDTKPTILGEYSRSVTGGTAAFYNSSYGVLSDIHEGDPPGMISPRGASATSSSIGSTTC